MGRHGIVNRCRLLLGVLPRSFVQQAFGDGPSPLVAGQFAPNGVAVPDGDTYAITGSYNFGSGIEHADWVGCGSFTAPTDGTPADYMFAVVPKEEANITGNWDVLGLRATASYDYSIDSTVPADRTFSFGGHTRHRGGPMYDLGVLCLTEVGHPVGCLVSCGERSTRRPSSPARSSA